MNVTLQIQFRRALLIGMTAAVAGLIAHYATKSQKKSRGDVAESAAGSASSPPSAPYRFAAPARLVAIGDLHGDSDATRRVLRLAGAIDASDRWTGGRLWVVQVGDQLDREDGDRDILEFLERLKPEAKRAGGRLVVLNGNHEVMNVQGDFRYTTPGGFRAFQSYASLQDGNPVVDRFPSLERGRVAAFMPGGPVARQLARRNVICIVGDSVFVHGGVLPEHVSYGIGRINAETSAWMRGDGTLPAIMQSDDAPIWTRRYSEQDVDAATCTDLDHVLAELHARRMVVGHTVQGHGINSACDGHVWRIDVGLSRFFGGPTEALEIEGDHVRVLGPLPRAEPAAAQ
jgi:Calcineurin-like phosphoesterase